MYAPESLPSPHSELVEPPQTFLALSILAPRLHESAYPFLPADKPLAQPNILTQTHQYSQLNFHQNHHVYEREPDYGDLDDEHRSGDYSKQQDSNSDRLTHHEVLEPESPKALHTSYISLEYF
jgi:hypothetical protein